jgi:hypothetical protein
MSRARNLADLLDTNGDVVSGALDNVPPSNDASALTTGTLPIARIADGDITAAKLSDTYLTGIADGSVTDAKLASTLDLSGKTVTLPAGTSGKVLQVVSTTKTNTFSSFLASAARAAITGLSVSITPSGATNKILIICHVSMAAENVGCAAILKRNSIDICTGTGEGLRAGVTVGSSKLVSSYEDSPVSSFTFLDSPSTTSSTTYSVDIFNGRSAFDTVYVNRGSSDSNYSYTVRTSSTITVMEIAA